MSGEAIFEFEWDGDNMLTTPRSKRAADQQFVVGQLYRLQQVAERSDPSHNHYFAALNEAWRNLPEDLAERFPTVEGFRKWLLIACHYCTKQEMALDTPQDALRVVSFMLNASEDYCVIRQRGNVVERFVAMSQSRRAMPDKATFEKSKTDVLELAASLIGVTRDQLSTEGRRTMA